MTENNSKTDIGLYQDDINKHQLEQDITLKYKQSEIDAETKIKQLYDNKDFLKPELQPANINLNELRNPKLIRATKKGSIADIKLYISDIIKENKMNGIEVDTHIFERMKLDIDNTIDKAYFNYCSKGFFYNWNYSVRSILLEDNTSTIINKKYYYSFVILKHTTIFGSKDIDDKLISLSSELLFEISKEIPKYLIPIVKSKLGLS